MKYEMRRYESGQAEKLAAFAVPIASRTYANWTDPASAGAWALSEHGATAWEARLSDPATHVLVCERPDFSIAACAFVRIGDDTAYLGGLYVEDVACGLGTRLRDERLRIGREAGVRTASMLIRETNAPARILAERAGFEIVDVEPCSRLSTVPRLRYSMRLTAPSLLPA